MRIASIGDSFTEGVGDVGPHGVEIGWAERVAMGFAAARPDEEVWHANFAVRGRLLEPIATEQLDAALALDPPPTHLTFNGGGNDMLRPGFDDARMMELYTRILDRCAEAGISVVFATGANPADRLPAGKRVEELSLRLGDLLIPLIESYNNVTFVDNFTADEGRKPTYWDPDRLHLSPYGHQWIASRVLTAMGVPTEGPDISGVRTPPRTALHEVWYYLRYIVPWFGRRIIRRSSGHGRSPKFPDWVRMPSDGTPP